MKKKEDLVSVVMAVYNGETYLRAAIQSVLDQTYTNFEFIIVNDASTDSTESIIEGFQDKRIRMISNSRNLRLAASLNRGIQVAKGKYILRMDADDICLPMRFEKQIAFMEKHPEIGVAFGSVIKFSDGKRLSELDTNERKPEYIRATMLFYNTVYHPNVIMRREIFEHYKYTSEYSVSEDMELWLRITDKYSIAKMNENTLLYRIHKKQVSNVYHDKQIEQEIQMKKQYLERVLGTVTEEECKIHSKVSYRRAQIPISELQMWLKKLKQGNKETHIYNEKVFEQVLIRVGMITACYNQYPFKMAEYIIREFGFCKWMFSILRIIQNLIVESVVVLPNIFLIKKVITKYDMEKSAKQ